MAVLSALLLTGLVVTFTQTVLGQEYDKRAYYSLGASSRAWALIVDPLLYITLASLGLLTCALVFAACLRSRADLAVSALVVIAGSNVTTQVLKHSIVYHPGVTTPSLPSGHTTVAVSVCVAAMLVASPGVRALLLPVSGFVTTFVGAGTVVGRWHRPSDVVAALCVVLVWTALAIALSRRMSGQRSLNRSDATSGELLARMPLGGAAGVGLVFVVLGVRPAVGELHVAAFTLVAIAVACALSLGWVSGAVTLYLPRDAQPVSQGPSHRRLVLFFGGVAVLGGVGSVRASHLGRVIEEHSRISIGGWGYAIEAAATPMYAVPFVTVAVFLTLIAVAVRGHVTSSRRDRVVLALLLMILVNVSVQVIKKLLAATVLGAPATLPSGHASMTLTTAVAIIALTPLRWRAVGAFVAGFWASVGMLGVVTARMHTVGDAVAAAALLLACAAIVTWARAHLRPTTGGSQRIVVAVERHFALSVAAGALLWPMLVLLIGVHPITTTVGQLVVGSLVFFGLPALAAITLVLFERVAQRSRAG